MNIEHITDEQIQVYVTGMQDAEAGTISHLAVCEHCAARMESYKILITEIEQLSLPAYDPGLSTLVMSKLRQERKSIALTGWLIYGLVLSGFIVTIAVVFTFRDFYLQAFSGFTGAGVAVVITIVLMLLMFQLLTDYKNYQRRMDALNIY